MLTLQVNRRDDNPQSHTPGIAGVIICAKTSKQLLSLVIFMPTQKCGHCDLAK